MQRYRTQTPQGIILIFCAVSYIGYNSREKHINQSNGSVKKEAQGASFLTDELPFF
jgi:hypothetical protein